MKFCWHDWVTRNELWAHTWKTRLVGIGSGLIIMGSGAVACYYGVGAGIGCAASGNLHVFALCAIWPAIAFFFGFFCLYAGIDGATGNPLMSRCDAMCLKCEKIDLAATKFQVARVDAIKARELKHAAWIIEDNNYRSRKAQAETKLTHYADLYRKGQA